jgi:hypothetical protein
MKKKWLIYPMLALVCAVFAGILVTGCPSDPDPAPAKLENPDVDIKKGVSWYDFWDEEKGASTFTFRKDREYEVILDLTKLDDWLGGCHFQAQLFFTNPVAPDTDFLLAGSRNAVPSVIDSKKGKKYRFTFKIGDLEAGDDSLKTKEKRAEEGGYELPIVVPASLPPAGGKVRLKITLKTPNWYTVALPWDEQEQNEGVNDKDNAGDWGVDYYDPKITMGALGEITVRQKPNFTEDYSPSATQITVNEDVDSTGKGSMGGVMFTTLAYAPKDAVLRVAFFANVQEASGAKSSGGDAAAPGWGVIEFGNGQEQDKQRKQNINLAVNIPTRDSKGDLIEAPATATVMGPFYEYVYVEDVLAACFPDDNWVSVNVYNGARLSGYADPPVAGDPVGLTLFLKDAQ